MEKNTVDIVYILGTGSRWHNNEIRYSIRSLEKFAPHHGRIFVVGELPEWLTGVTHIKAADSERNKIMNARNKYLAAASDPRVSAEFVLMNDDFFLTKEVEKWVTYSRGKLDALIKRHPTQDGYYYRSLTDTKKKLDAMGITDPTDYEVHCPMIFNKEKLLGVIGMVGSDKAYSIRTCYGNLADVEAKKTVDFKAAQIAEFAYQVKRDAPYLSINDALVASEEFRNWAERKYPKVSRYEIDEGKGTKNEPGRAIRAMRFQALKSFTYGKHNYAQGDVIHETDMHEIKKTPRLAGIWRLK
jgi:hypothetical protein